MRLSRLAWTSLLLSFVDTDSSISGTEQSGSNGNLGAGDTDVLGKFKIRRIGVDHRDEDDDKEERRQLERYVGLARRGV